MRRRGAARASACESKQARREEKVRRRRVESGSERAFSAEASRSRQLCFVCGEACRCKMLDGLEAEAARLAVLCWLTQGNKRAAGAAQAQARSGSNNGRRSRGLLVFADARRLRGCTIRYLVGSSRRAERVAEVILAAVLVVVAGVGELQQ